MSRLDRNEEFTDTVFTRDRRAWWSGMDVPGVNITSDERLTVREAFRTYLPWEVRKIALYDPETFEPTAFYGLKRSDTGRILATASDRFTVVQNAEVAELLSEALDGSEYAVASIGALQHGGTTFVSVDFDEAPTIEAGDQSVFPYLAVVNGNDGTGSLRVYATAIRPECFNTIDMGWLGGHKFAALRHTTNIKSRIGDVQADIRQFLNLPAKAERVVRRLIDARVDAVAYRRALEVATPIPEPKVKDGKVTNQRAVTLGEKRREQVLDLAYNDERVGYEGTVWGLFQTLSTFDQWERRVSRRAGSDMTTVQHGTLARLFSGEQATRDGDRLELAFRATGVDAGVRVTKAGLVLA
jgi:phage/plasmid-like protein (TIGR03299 family)